MGVGRGVGRWAQKCLKLPQRSSTRVPARAPASAGGVRSAQQQQHRRPYLLSGGPACVRTYRRAAAPAGPCTPKAPAAAWHACRPAQPHPSLLRLHSSRPTPAHAPSLQLRGIVATFRMTSRAQPSRPSHYVSMILAPLHQFLQARATRPLCSCLVLPPWFWLLVKPHVLCCTRLSRPVLAGNATQSAGRHRAFGLRLGCTLHFSLGPSAVDKPHPAAPWPPALQGEAASQLSAEARQQLAAAVAAGVSSRYLHLADDTLRCGCAHRWPIPCITRYAACMLRSAAEETGQRRRVGRTPSTAPPSAIGCNQAVGCTILTFTCHACPPTPHPLPQHCAQDRVQPQAAQGAAAGRRRRRGCAGLKCCGCAGFQAQPEGTHCWGAAEPMRPSQHWPPPDAMPAPASCHSLRPRRAAALAQSFRPPRPRPPPHPPPTTHHPPLLPPCSARRHRQDDRPAAVPGCAGVWPPGQAGATACRRHRMPCCLTAVCLLAAGAGSHPPGPAALALPLRIDYVNQKCTMYCFRSKPSCCPTGARYLEVASLTAGTDAPAPTLPLTHTPPPHSHVHKNTTPLPAQAGVDAAQLESYQQLWRMVAPEEQAGEPISF